MKLIEIATAAQLKKFINMADAIYDGDDCFVPYMRRDLFKTLKRPVLKDKTYSALAVEEDGRYVARVLFTVMPSKQLKIQKCGFFSHFECINDEACANMLLDGMCRALKERGATYAQGTYFPLDQDNRRGILASGYEFRPMILTSYNPPYYCELLEKAGFKKDFDTVSYFLDMSAFDDERISATVAKIMQRYDLQVDHADLKNIDKEIDDIHEVIAEATNDIIFEEAPSREDLRRIAKNWKSFLWEDFIFICRRKSDGKPVGVMMSVPDFNEVFRAIDGKSTPFALLKALRLKKKIKAVRAMMQYVIPQYQNKGVNYALYHEFYLSCLRRGVNYMEGGTIMENNVASRKNTENAGGRLNKIFRIYGREL